MMVIVRGWMCGYGVDQSVVTMERKKSVRPVVAASQASQKFILT
jgi:hypothetical protein